jgi:DNA-directed RNA polymerase specialized sigma24 family protein
MARPSEATGFEVFFATAEPKLRRALVATYGGERGREATAEALAWAWEHWPKVQSMQHPLGYLYRVAQSRSRPRKVPILFARPSPPEPWVEPALADALAGLSERQRVCVVLIHGFEWTLREVADLTDTAITTVETHLRRGLDRLRVALEVTEDAGTG